MILKTNLIRNQLKGFPSLFKLFSDTKSEKPFIIYGTNDCGFCLRAKDYLTKEQVSFDFKNADEEPYASEARELKSKHAWRTVPLIFCKGEFLGGYQEMMKKIKNKQINIDDYK